MAKAGYTEPSNYFPKEIRKEFKLGEYAEPEEQDPSLKNKKDRDITNEEFREYIKNGK